MKKITVFFLIAVLLPALSACGPKNPIAPTAIPTEIPTETVSEPVPEEPAAGSEALPEAYDQEVSASDPAMAVLMDLTEAGERMENSLAFIVLDTAGKSVWKAPLAGLEFAVPDYMIDAHGGIRALGGYETIPGSGIVSLDVVYYSMTEAEYTDMLEKIPETTGSQDTAEEKTGVSKTYTEAIHALNSHMHPLFSVIGIGNDQDEAAILAAERKVLEGSGIYTAEEIDQMTGGRTFTKIGTAEDYTFYFVQKAIDESDLAGLEADGEVYKAEYTALYNAKDQIVIDFTLSRPIGLQEQCNEK